MARATEKKKRPATARKKKGEAPKRQPDFVEYFRYLASQIPEEEARNWPTDLAEQHDHYIYGTPKK
jgi:hypothetical protein